MDANYKILNDSVYIYIEVYLCFQAEFNVKVTSEFEGISIYFMIREATLVVDNDWEKYEEKLPYITKE